MSIAYIGQIMVFGGLFVPADWLACDGSLQQISSYQALFQLIGTTFGGDGHSTFGLPNLQGGVIIHQGQFPDGGYYPLGEEGGISEVWLSPEELPVHGHALSAVSNPSSGTATPGGSALLADAASGAAMYAPGLTADSTLAPGSIAPTGGSKGHQNMQPVLGMITCICVNGAYPSRD